MFVIVGLGNPGKKYKNTRHNIGARVVNEIETSKNKELVLAKPQTYMNESGKAVKKIIRNLKLEIRNLVVVHDDIDLPLGEIKIVQNRGAAGHKGVESIIDTLGTKDFNRIRIGICPQSGKPKDVEKFVLQNFTKDEEMVVKEVVGKTVGEIEKKYSTSGVE